MHHLTCRKETTLSIEEKQKFQTYLEKNCLAENVWDLFDDFITINREEAQFFYVKVFSKTELVGIGLFLRVKPYDLSNSDVNLRKNPLIKKLVTGVSNMWKISVYFSFRFLTANLTRPFFCQNPEHEDQVLEAILSYLKQESDADMVIIMDSDGHDEPYKNAGFNQYMAPSETWIDPTNFTDISEYLRQHRSAKKHISQKKNKIIPEIKKGPVDTSDVEDMMECLAHSIHHSKMNTPFQKIFESHISKGELFQSDKYVFVNIRIDNKIVGFTNYIISNSTMAAVIGGYNRDYTRNNYIYERLFVKSLEYAIENNITRLCYGIVDNMTKLRLTGSFDSMAMYFYSPRYFFRKMIHLTRNSNDLAELCSLEREGRAKFWKN